MHDNRNPLNNTPEATYPNMTLINTMLPVLVPAIGKQTKPSPGRTQNNQIGAGFVPLQLWLDCTCFATRACVCAHMPHRMRARGTCSEASGIDAAAIARSPPPQKK